MALKREKLDTIEGIDSSTQAMTFFFANLKDEADPFGLVSKYRQDVEKTLQNLDARMCAIMNVIDDRIMWASKMRSCHRMMRVITMNLAVWGKPEWSWDEVAEAMAFLRAITQGAESTLWINEPEKPVENTTAP